MQDTNPISIRMIDHVVIRANDLTRMQAFYQDVLGCVYVRGPGDYGLVQLRAGDALIDLVDVNGVIGRKGGGAPDPKGRNMDHLCLLLENWDFAAIKQHLAAHGIEAPAPEDRFGARGKGPSIYIDDPEGNAVELKGDATV